MDELLVVRIAAAALGGAAVGVERQWSGHASGPHARFVGWLWGDGVLAGTARLTLASGIIAVTSLLLVEKSRLHAWLPH